jgi:hypothetical protein
MAFVEYDAALAANLRGWFAPGEQFSAAMAYALLADSLRTFPSVDEVFAALKRLAQTPGSGVKRVKASLYELDCWYVLTDQDKAKMA